MKKRIIAKQCGQAGMDAREQERDGSAGNRWEMDEGFRDEHLEPEPRALR